MKTELFRPIILAVTMLTAFVSSILAQGIYYVAGDFNGWNAAGNVMTETYAGSGIWQVSLTMNGGRHEFKVTQGTWSWSTPSTGNSWLYTDATGNIVITYDANTYADGWFGTGGRIGLSFDPQRWTAVGDWQGWNNSDPGTAMPPAGGGIYALPFLVASPGTYQYKAVDTGSWDGIGADARSVNANPLIFTTANPNQGVVFYVNATNGTIKTDVQPPLPCISTNSIIKFYQPPQIFDGLDVNDSRNNILLADDFRCASSGPITDIHMWGSWWNDAVGTITNFMIGIYGDVPAATNYQTGQVTNSHPGALLWWTNFPRGGIVTQGLYTNNAYEHFYNPLNNQIVGPDSKVFYYCFFPANPFIQQGSPNAPTNYWLAVRAQLPNDGTTNGWKSAATTYNDPAVWVTAGGVLPGIGAPWKSMTNPMTLQPIHLSMLLTSSNLPPVTDTNKWTQVPDASTNGLDVKATTPKVLADDFLCNSTGPITEVRLWGSWNFDNYPTAQPCFNLGIWTDVPRQGTIPSHPGQLLCNWFFNAGQYIGFPYTNNVNEFFFDPNLGGYIGQDHTIWEYIFDWPTNYPCIQTNGNIYWLSVTAECITDTNAFMFGWKTCPTNWNDDAVYGDAPAVGGPPTSWYELRRPPFFTNSLDLAFQIITTPHTNPPPQTNCCPETNTVKWVQYPDLNYGVDVDASFNPSDPCVFPGNWVLADDFPCTNSGSIKDIHLWGSWYNDRVDPTAVFTLSIWSDVPNSPAAAFSHPGNLLWSQYYLPGQYGLCRETNAIEIFADGAAAATPICGAMWSYTTNLYNLCFAVPLPSYPSNVFYQTGTAAVKTNYWLSVTVQGTNYFGWKTSATVYNDYAVGSVNGTFFPTNGDWSQIYDPNFLPLNMAFMIGTATNACTTPPQLQCSDLTISCTNLSWTAPIPAILDPCCPAGSGTLTNTGPFVISNCPTVYQYKWQYTNCLGLTAFCSSYVTVTSAPPVIVPTNITIICGSPMPTNPPAVKDLCCSNIVPVWLYSITNAGECKLAITQFWKAVNCDCTNLFTIGYQAVTVLDTNPPIMFNCGSNFVVNCGTAWAVPIPTAKYVCSGSNAMVTMLSSNTVIVNPCLSSNIIVWSATNLCSGAYSICTQTITVLDTNAPVLANCGTNKVVSCGTAWTFALPTAKYTCSGSNVFVGILTSNIYLISPCLSSNLIVWSATNQCSGAYSTCAQAVMVVDTNAPVMVNCGTNMTVPCGTSWFVTAPTAKYVCTGSNVYVGLLSSNAVAASPCLVSNIFIWSATNQCSGAYATCSQVVTVVDTNPPILMNCGTNMTVLWGNPWAFTMPAAQYVCSGSNAPVGILSSNVIILSSCSSSNMIVWSATNRCSGAYSTCTQVVTVICTPCTESNGVKYVQRPNLSGLDVWDNGPWMLADDFICTNGGPISDIHIWGSWLGDQVGRNTLTFWLGIYEDVPAVTNINGQILTNSHPGALRWQQSFAPGQYAENPVATGQESFLNPGLSNILGSDSLAWYYCFYPKAPLFQSGTMTTPKIYWLAVYAKPASNSFTQFGWKSTFVVSNDISVHALWPGNPLTNNPAWTATWQPQVAGGYSPVDLAFKITTDTNYNNILKYIQSPNTNGGYDVWNSSTRPPIAPPGSGPWVLADDFVCTNTGYISDFHIWGSWYNDVPTPGMITFWIGLFDDVPTNSANPFSHPGSNFWSQCFPPGTYLETYAGSAYEHFLDPEPPMLLGPESQIWKYDFFPTNPPIQWGSLTRPQTYWVGVFAQLPTGGQSYFGWKTTTNVQHDVSVHLPWTFGLCPTSIPQSTNWITTRLDIATPLDLSFAISTITNCSKSFLMIERISDTQVRLTWPSGILQSATGVVGPYTDVLDGFSNPVPSPWVTTYPPPPQMRFFRVRCD